MSTWLLVWIIASGVSIAVLCIFLASMGSQVLQLTRAARRFQAEVGGLAADISRGSRRASERVSSLPTPGKGRSA
ncbi:MAG: hypothetical protein ACJ76A_09440 [Actinomycetota bacterium]|jgi:hypothetical protein